MKSYLAALILLLINFPVFAQNNMSGTVNGFVYDESNGEALIGANVYLKGTNLGAGTNLSGYFAIPNVTDGNYTITASYIGYRSQEKQITVGKGKNSILKFYLKEDLIEGKEVVVTGDSARTVDKLFSKPISKVELSAQQINNVPRVIEADLLRSLQTLPGVQPLSDFSSALYVRGGTPDQNLYMIDGTDVYNPEHAFGLFSTFNTNAIKKVELSKGGFSAQYGGRLSSVLDITNLDGNRNRIQGDVSISLISGATTLQAPLGNFGSISGSFRRTYIDQTYAKVIDEIPDYYFYDGNLKAFLDLNEKNKLVISFYGGQDRLDYIFNKDDANSLGFKYDWGNMTGSVNWKRIFSPNLFASFWITGSRFSSVFDFESAFYEKNIIEDVTLKGNLEYYISKNFNLKFGFEEKFLHGLLREEFTGGLVDANKYRNHYTGYITSNWKPTERFDIETGLRYDYFNSEKDYQNLDPRFSIKYRLTETSILKASTGIFHQYLNRIPRLFFASIWTTADEFTKGSSAQHFILGFQKELWQIYEFEIEGYYKKYKDVYSFNQNMLTEIQANKYNENNDPVFTDTRGLFNRGDGNSYGIEVLLRKDYGAINGWIGYSYARTENTIDGLNQGKSFIPRHDRTSTINTVTNIDITQLWKDLKNRNDQSNSKWLFTMNFLYSTGQPITLPGSIYVINSMPDWSANEFGVALYPAELNSLRLPAYVRMDVSLTYEMKWGKTTIAPYLQVFNVGDRKNVWFINYENQIKNGEVVQELETVNMLPVLPSLGINIKF